MGAEVVAQAMREYGQAMRGDWSDVNGRAVRDAMDEFASAVTGGVSAEWTIDRWRADLGLCPAGNGHWGGDGCCHDLCDPAPAAGSPA